MFKLVNLELYELKNLFTFDFLESFLLILFFSPSCIEKKTKTILTSLCLFLLFFVCEKDARNTKLTQP